MNYSYIQTEPEMMSDNDFCKLQQYTTSYSEA